MRLVPVKPSLDVGVQSFGNAFDAAYMLQKLKVLVVYYACHLLERKGKWIRWINVLQQYLHVCG